MKWIIYMEWYNAFFLLAEMHPHVNHKSSITGVSPYLALAHCQCPYKYMYLLDLLDLDSVQEKGYLIPTLVWKITLPTFQLNVPVIIRAKVWSIQSKRQQVIFRTQVGNRFHLCRSQLRSHCMNKKNMNSVALYPGSHIWAFLSSF